MDSPQQFFKTRYHSISSRFLELPSCLARALPNVCFLQNIQQQNKLIWPVTLDKCGDDYFFGDGWKKLVEENQIGCGDKLYFKNKSNGMVEFKFKFSGTDNEPDQENMNEERNEELMEALQNGDGAKPRRTRKHVDSRGSNLFNKSNPRPKRPYFVTTVKPKRMNELFIPTHVEFDPRIDLPNKIALIDPIGKKFFASKSKWKNGRTIYKGGWSKLCRLNFVDQDDFCICEFMRDKHRRTYLKIRLVRGNQARNNC